MITTHFINNKNRFFEHGDPKVTTLETVENEGGGASDTMKKNTIATRVLGSLLTLGTIASFAQPVFAQISEEAPISTTGEPIAQQVESAPNPNSVLSVPGQANQLGGIQQVQPTGNVYLPQSGGFQNQNPTGKPFFINTQIKVITPFNGQPSTEFLLQAGAGLGKSDAEIQSNNNRAVGIEQAKSAETNTLITSCKELTANIPDPVQRIKLFQECKSPQSSQSAVKKP